MKRRILARPIAAFVGLLALSSLVHAQAASATLRGTVLDESSAVVPLLSPGRYRVTAERDEFRPARRSI